jgi:6-phosphogluconolactonase (cycloisomerase 2 family)
VTPRRIIRRFGIAVVGAALALTVSPFTLTASASPGRAGAVYTESNDPAGNAVLVFHRAADGTLTPGPSVDTGGLGAGGKLGSQGALTLSESGRWLLAVNAGSDSVSLFRLRTDGMPELADTAPSGGDMPISVTTSGNLAYVLDAGSDAISGLRVSNGSISPIPGSTRSLSGAGVGPAEVAFAREGRVLVVTEKNTNLIDTFRVGPEGRAEGLRSTPSSGATPFGFAVKGRDVLVSEAFGGAAGASATSSYAISPGGAVRTVTPSAADGQSAACWVATLANRQSVYVANTGSNDVSRYSARHGGRLTLQSANAASTGAAPADMALSSGDRYLYVLNGSDGTISGFAVDRDGSLASLGVTAGIPTGIQAGLAAI